jgi:hypothetical protein
MGPGKAGHVENAPQTPSRPGEKSQRTLRFPTSKGEQRVYELTRAEFDTVIVFAVFKGLLAFSFLAGLVWLLLVVGAS